MKQGDNTLGNVHLSVSPFIHLSLNNVLLCLEGKLNLGIISLMRSIGFYICITCISNHDNILQRDHEGHHIK